MRQLYLFGFIIIISCQLAFSQNVGIGTGTPDEKLEVTGNTMANKFIDRDNDSYYIDPANSGAAGAFNGKVGIGTTSPQSDLDIGRGEVYNVSRLENAGPYNLFRNSDFESNFTAHLDVASRTNAESYSGSYSIMAGETGWPQYEEVWNHTDAGGMPALLTGETYTLSFWAKNTTSSNIEYGYAGSGGYLKTTIPANSGWAFYSVTDQAENSGTSFEMRDNVSWNGKVYIDNVVLSKGETAFDKGFSSRDVIDHVGHLNLNSNPVINVSDPNNPQDAATKNYVDSRISGSDEWTVNGSDLYPNNTSWQVGIGTTSPTNRLHVEGDLLVSNKFKVGGFNNIYESSSDLVFAISGTGGEEARLVTDGSNYANTQFEVGNNVVINSNGDSYLNGGSLGVNTSSPSATLDVNGNAHANSFKDGDNTSYYVDPASTGTSFNLAGSINFANSNQRINGDFSAYNFLGLDEDNLSIGSSNQVLLSSANEMFFSIDANNNSGGAAFDVGKDTDDPGDGNWVSLFRVDESGYTRLAGDLDMSSNQVISVADPSSAQHAATKNYVDNQISGNDNWSENGNKIYNNNNGNVGIGVSNPSAPLHVNTGGNDDAILLLEKTINSPEEYGLVMEMDGDGDDDVLIDMRADNDGPTVDKSNSVFFVTGYGKTALGIDYNIDAGPTNQLEVGGNASIGSGYAGNGAPSNGLIVEGSVGIGVTNPSSKLDVNGRINSNGITETSDKRLKKDIHTLQDALGKIESLRGVSYKWRTEEYPEKNFKADEHIGVVAQEVEKVLPEVVNTDGEGYKSVEYSHLTPVLIEAIKELSKENRELRNRLQRIEAKLGIDEPSQSTKASTKTAK